jgi:hypothetical protein
MAKEPNGEDQGEAAPDVFPYFHYGWFWPSREAPRYLLAVFGEPEPPSLGVATFDDQRKVVAKSTWPGRVNDVTSGTLRDWDVTRRVNDVTSGTLRDWLEALPIEAEAVEKFAKAWELRLHKEAG